MPGRRTIIGVIGSGSSPHTDISRQLGAWIAHQGFHLVNGGGRGVMQAVAEGFHQSPRRKGLVIGVLPSTTACQTPVERINYQSPSGYPNDFVDIPIFTHLPFSGSRGMETASRNHIVVLSSDFIVALPGSEGTRSEIQLCRDYRKPHVVLNRNKAWQSLEGSGSTLVNTLEDVYEAIMQWKNAG